MLSNKAGILSLLLIVSHFCLPGDSGWASMVLWVQMYKYLFILTPWTTPFAMCYDPPPYLEKLVNNYS